MSGALIAAGALALLGAAVHGGAGEVLVVRKLSPATLAGSRFGGPRMTMAMIHVTWHITTAAFLAVGIALIVAGTALEGDARQALGAACAAAATAFALVMLTIGVAYMRTPRKLLSHPGPFVFGVAAALAWWGSL